MERGFQWPPLDLEPFIDRFWWWRSEPGEIVALPLLAPGVGAELFLHAGLPFRWEGEAESGAPAQLIAVRNGPLDFSAQRELDFLAVRFRAGALRHFLPSSPEELREDRLPAEALWGPSILELLERIQTMDTRAAQMAHVCLWLRERRTRCWRPDRAVDKALEAVYGDPSGARVGALAEGVGLGPRQLQRRFKAALGMSPKRFQGLVRLYRLVRREVLDPDPGYLDSALELGYFDQSHVIHDFQALLGQSPGRFLNEAKSRTHFYNPSRRGRI